MILEKSTSTRAAVSTHSPFTCGMSDALAGNARNPHYYHDGKFVKYLRMTELQIMEYDEGYESVFCEKTG